MADQPPEPIAAPDEDPFVARLIGNAQKVQTGEAGKYDFLQDQPKYSPDAVAKARRIGEASNVTPSLILEDLETYSRMHEQKQLRERGAVKTADWLSDPKNAAVGHDDAESLSMMESMLRDVRSTASFKAEQKRLAEIRSKVPEGRRAFFDNVLTPMMLTGAGFRGATGKLGDALAANFQAGRAQTTRSQQITDFTGNLQSPSQPGSLQMRDLSPDEQRAWNVYFEMQANPMSQMPKDFTQAQSNILDDINRRFRQPEKAPDVPFLGPAANVVGQLWESIPSEFSRSFQGLDRDIDQMAPQRTTPAALRKLYYTMGIPAAAVDAAVNTTWRPLYTAALEEGKLKGLSDEQANRAAVTAANLGSQLEIVGDLVTAGGLTITAKALKNVFAPAAIKSVSRGKALERVAIGAGMSGLSEGVQEGGQEAIGIAALQNEGVDYSPKEVVSRISENAWYGFQAGAVLGGAGGLFQMATQEMALRRAEKNQEFFEGLAEGAATSKLAKRYPQGFGDAVGSMVEGTGLEEVRVAPAGMLEFFQTQGIDLESGVKQLGLSVDEVRVAIASGADIVIPTKVYAEKLARAEGWQSLQQHMRLRPDDPTQFERQAEDASLERKATDLVEEGRRLAEEDEDARAFVEELTPAFSEMETRLVEERGQRYAGYAEKQAFLYAALAKTNGDPKLPLRDRLAQFKVMVRERNGRLARVLGGGQAATSAEPTFVVDAKQAGYEGSDTGEAQSWLNAKAKGLDLSKEGRMARAKEMGFDTSRTVYHGTPDSRGLWEDGFKTPKEKFGEPDPERVYFFADNKKVASTYADDRRAWDYQNAEAETLPLYLRMQNPKVIDWGGRPFRGREKDGAGYAIRDYIDQARADGHDGVVINNVIDTYDGKGKPSTIRAVFDPSNIRSVNAAFDPDESGSSNLLAQYAGLDELAEWARSDAVAVGESIDEAGSRYGFRVKTTDRKGAPVDDFVIVKITEDTTRSAMEINWDWISNDESGDTAFAPIQLGLEDATFLLEQVVAITMRDMEERQGSAYVFTPNLNWLARKYRVLLPMVAEKTGYRWTTLPNSDTYVLVHPEAKINKRTGAVVDENPGEQFSPDLDEAEAADADARFRAALGGLDEAFETLRSSLVRNGRGGRNGVGPADPTDGSAGSLNQEELNPFDRVVRLFSPKPRQAGPAPGSENRTPEEARALGAQMGMTQGAYRGMRGAWDENAPQREVWDFSGEKPVLVPGAEFWTDDYEVADSYAGGNEDNVYPALLNTKDAVVIDAKGAEWSEIPTEVLPPVIRKLFKGNPVAVTMDQIEVATKKAGIPTVEIRNIQDGYASSLGKASTVWMVHDRSLRRSVRARFDPKNKGATGFFDQREGPQLDPMGFYSATYEAALGVPESRWGMGWDAVRNTIAKGRGSPSRPKNTELQYLKLDEMFAGTDLKGPELRTAVLEHIAAHRLELVERFNRFDPENPGHESDLWLVRVVEDKEAGGDRDLVGYVTGWDSEAKAKAKAEQLASIGAVARITRKPGPKARLTPADAGIRRGPGDIRLPGGKVFEWRALLPARDEYWVSNGFREVAGPFASEEEARAAKPKGAEYSVVLRRVGHPLAGVEDEHWSRPPSNDRGVVVTIRGEDRIDDQGERTLFGGELQKGSIYKTALAEQMPFELSSTTRIGVLALLIRGAREGFPSISFPTGETSTLIQGNNSAASHYDTNVKGALERIARQLGGEVRLGGVQYGDGVAPEPSAGAGGNLRVVWAGTNEDLDWTRRYATMAEAEAVAQSAYEQFGDRAEVIGNERPSRASTAPAYVLPITPEMRGKIVAEGFPLFAKNQEGARQGTTTVWRDPLGNMTEAVIETFATADASTMLHESAHVFLEVIQTLARDPNSNPRVKRIWSDTLKWFGLTQEQWDGLGTLTLEGQREYHEQWARSFEAYLMEGKAPSPFLKEAFASFKKWLIEVYGMLTGLKRRGADISPEVRDIFDRMLATDDEIAAARAEQGARFMFANHQEAGLTEQQFNEFKAKHDELTGAAVDPVLATIMRKLLLKKKRSYQLIHRAFEREVAREEDAKPVRAAENHLSGITYESVTRTSEKTGKELTPEYKRVSLDKPSGEPAGSVDQREVPAWHTEALRLHDNGMRNADIARQLDVTPSAVAGLIDRTTRRRWKDQEYADHVRLPSFKTSFYAPQDLILGDLDGMTYKEMAAEFGGDRVEEINLGTLSNHINDVREAVQRATTKDGALEWLSRQVLVSQDQLAVFIDRERIEAKKRRTHLQTASSKARELAAQGITDQRVLEREVRAWMASERLDTEYASTTARDAAYDALRQGGGQSVSFDQNQNEPVLASGVGGRFMAFPVSDTREIPGMLRDQKKEGLDPSVRWMRTPDGTVWVFDGNKGLHADLARTLGVSLNDIDLDEKGEINTPQGLGELRAVLHGGAAGQLNQDEIPEAYRSVRLDLPAIREAYGDLLAEEFGPEWETKLSKAVLTRAADEKVQPVDIDTFAGLFGMSGHQLLRELVLLPDRKQSIDDAVKARLTDRFGDPLEDGTLPEEAMKAVHDEVAAEAVALELELIARAAGYRARPMNNAAKMMAQRALSAMSLKQILGYDSFLAVERREARNAEQLFREGKPQEAWLHKQRQLVAMHLWRLSRNAAEEVEVAQRKWKRLADSTTTREAIHPDFRDQIDQILEILDLRQVTNKEMLRRASFNDWLRSMQEQGLEHLVAADPAFVEKAARVPFVALNYDDFQGLKAAIDNLEHIGRRWDKALEERANRLLNEEIDEAVKVASEMKPIRLADSDNPYDPSLAKRADEKREEIHNNISRPVFYFRGMSGFRENGPTWRMIMGRIRDGRSKRVEMTEQARTDMEGINGVYTAVEWSDMMTKRIYVPELWNPQKRANGMNLTKERILSMALNMGNSYNRDALLEGLTGYDPGRLPAVTEAVQTILNRYMTKKDWDYVQSVWDYLDTFRPEIGRLYRDVQGVEPKWVEAEAVQTKFGEYRGGFYHIEYDWGRDKSRADHDKQFYEQLQNSFGGFRSSTRTANGFTKERKGSGGRAVRLSLDVWSQHVDQVIQDLALRRAVLDVGKIINNPKFREAYGRYAGDEALADLKPWLIYIAHETMPPVRGWNGVIRLFRKNTPLVFMGYALGTIMQQVTGPFTAAARIGLVPWMRSIVQRVGVFWQWPRLIKDTYDMSPIVRSRVRSFDISQRDMAKQMQSQRFVNAMELMMGGRPVEGIQALMSYMKMHAFYPMGVLQSMMDVLVWNAARDKALAGEVEGIDAKDEAAIRQYADDVVTGTQGSGLPEDLAPIQRTDELGKLLTPMWSYMGTQYNMIYNEGVPGLYNGKISPIEFMTLIFMLGMSSVLADMLAGRLNDDDDDQEEKIKGSIAKAVVSVALGGVPIVGGAAQSAANTLVTGKEFNSNSIAALGAIDSGYGFIQGVTNDLQDQELDRETVKDAVYLLGYLRGAPARQGWNTGEYLYDVTQGSEDPLGDPASIYQEGLLRDTR